MGRLHIPRNHRRRIGRRKHGALRQDHLKRLHHPFIHGNAVLNQKAKHIKHRRPRHRLRRIIVRGQLTRRPREVDLGRARHLINGDLHANLAIIPVKIRVHLIDIFCIRQSLDRAAHAFLRIVLNMAHVGLHHIQPEMAHHPAQLMRALLTRCHLRLEISHIDINRPHRIFGRK